MHYPASAFPQWLCLSGHINLKAVLHYILLFCVVDLLIEGLVLSLTDTPFTNSLCTYQGPRTYSFLDYSSIL